MPLFHIHGIVAGVLAVLHSGGGTLVPARLDPAELLEPLLSRATWCTAVPTIHQALLGAAAGDPRRPARLRFLRSCSSALPTTLCTALEERFGVPVLEAYGMTEASHQIAVGLLPPGTRKPGSVGTPNGTEVRIVDPQGVVVGAGREGEVLVRGAGVTAGYEDPEATARSFEDGWLRTGDQGRLDADGHLFLTGRIKELINRGGEKIAPRHIEEVLLEHPSVAAAAAFAVPHPVLGEEVGVAVTARPAQRIDVADLLRFARGRLSHFSLPRHVVTLEELPKGPTGKVQRIGLAARLGVDGSEPATAHAPYAAPATPLERALAAAFEEVLTLPGGSVGLDDDFLLLGGDSLGALRVCARLAAGGGASPAAPELLKLGTPRAVVGDMLARGLDAAGEDLEEVLRALEADDRKYQPDIP